MAGPWVLGSWGGGALFWVVVVVTTVVAMVVAMVRAVTSLRRARSLSRWDLKDRRSAGKVEGVGSWGVVGEGGVVVRAWSCLTRRRRASRSFLKLRRLAVRAVRFGVVVGGEVVKGEGEREKEGGLGAGLGLPGDWFLPPRAGGRGGDILWWDGGMGCVGG